MINLLDHLRNDFQGSADELILKALELARSLRLEQEASEGNERLLRHYVSVGVVDKPSREGRDALYGFRHLVQFVAARRLLAEGYPLAKIAGYTSAVTTDALVAYLEKPGRTSEAELLVAAFRSESAAAAPAPRMSRSAPATRPLAAMATGMGMVDVMHEMREMEKRVHGQLQDLQSRFQTLVDSALRDMGSRLQSPHSDPLELKHAVSQLADLMDDATRRFDHMLQKPLQLIEKQMDQQRYLFEEAHKQKDFLEQIFGRVFDQQRRELQTFFDQQNQRLLDVLDQQKQLQHALREQLAAIDASIAAHLAATKSHTGDQ
jgi:DNA-binding transcriptional MerR regulator